MLLVHLKIGRAEVVSPVEVIHLGNARFGAGFTETVQHVPGQALLLHPEPAALPVQVIVPLIVVL